jgi:hypothetical protein
MFTCFGVSIWENTHPSRLQVSSECSGERKRTVWLTNVRVLTDACVYLLLICAFQLNSEESNLTYGVFLYKVYATQL